MKIFGKHFDPFSLGRDAQWREEIEQAQAAHAVRCLNDVEAVAACPICESRNIERAIEIQGYPYFECVVCGHVFCGYVPQEEILLEMYQGDSENANAQHQVYLDHARFEQRVRSIATPKTEFVASALLEVDASINTWIDIGSGAGELLQAALTVADNVVGVECDRELVKMSRRVGAMVYETTASQFLSEAKLGHGDIVSFINVLEHIAQPATEIRNTARAAPEFILTEVPRHPSLASFTSFAFPDRAYRHIYPPDHLHIFSDKSLNILLDIHGYEPLAEWRFGQDLVDLLMTVMTGSVPLGSSEACGNFMQRNIDLLNTIQKAIDSNYFGDTILALFRVKNA